MESGEYVNILPLVENALLELESGQLIKLPSLSLLDLMSAVEIMDARTDSYLAVNKEESIESAEFDPNYNLLPEELIWLLDELLRLEMTFQDGHPLISTLFQCQYIRPYNLSQLRDHNESIESIPAAVGYKSVVLRALLLGIIKSTEIVWEELCTGQVYDHEDVQVGMASLTFAGLLASAFPAPKIDPLRIPSSNSKQDESLTPRLVGVDEILATLEQALLWVEASVENADIKEALTGRLSMRIDLIYALALLTEPIHTSPSQLQAHFTRIKTWITALSPPSLASSIQPSSILQAIFKPDKERGPLPSNQPVREIELVERGKIWKELENWVEEIGMALELWESWRGGCGWIGIREYFVSLARREMKPYPRSLHQSLLLTSSTLFATSSPLSLSSSFFEQNASISPQIWEALTKIKELELKFNDPARKILGWLDRISGSLVGVLKISGQNRGRGRRLIIKGLGGWEMLIDESKTFLPQIESLLTTHPLTSALSLPLSNLSLIPTSLGYLVLSQILESLLSGFELNLYEPEEFISIWFISARISELIGTHLGILLESAEKGSETEGYLVGKREEGKALELFCRGSILNHSISPPTRLIKFITPFIDSDNPELMEQTRFEKRFKWLNIEDLGGIKMGKLVRWEDYKSYLKTLEGEEEIHLVNKALSIYRESIEHLTALGGISLSTRGLQIRPEFPLRWLGSLRRTSFGNLNSLASLQMRDPTMIEKEKERESKWDNKWFPIWS